MIGLLLAERREESLTVYTDGFQAYEPPEEDDAFSHEYVVHSDSEYADYEVHVKIYEMFPQSVRTTSRTASKIEARGT